jgi:hypothetical protein
MRDAAQAFVDRWSFIARCVHCGTEVQPLIQQVSEDVALGTGLLNGEETGSANLRGV